jgi:endoglucanase
LNWKAINNRIEIDNRQFRMKGVSWFGFEIIEKILGGTDLVSYLDVLDFLQENDFNLIRLPFSWEIFITNSSAGDFNKTFNPDFVGLSFPQMYDKVVDSASERGILVMLDNVCIIYLLF